MKMMKNKKIELKTFFYIWKIKIMMNKTNKKGTN